MKLVFGLEAKGTVNAPGRLAAALLAVAAIAGVGCPHGSTPLPTPVMCQSAPALAASPPPSVPQQSPEPPVSAAAIAGILAAPVPDGVDPALWELLTAEPAAERRRSRAEMAPGGRPRVPGEGVS